MDYSNEQLIYVNWTMDSMLEITIPEPDSFLKIKETLTRIGVASRKDNCLYQSCHILHKQGKYYLVHFKELFALDGKETNISTSDLSRRNTIAILLQDWNLLKVVDLEKTADRSSLSSIKILSYAEKSQWTLVQKYAIGVRKIS
jgi:hypothetical protein